LEKNITNLYEGKETNGLSEEEEEEEEKEEDIDGIPIVNISSDTESIDGVPLSL
jgi:hypothetical protein